jgi:hypothetical protein
VRLRSRPFREGYGLPFFDELLGRHCVRVVTINRAKPGIIAAVMDAQEIGPQGRLIAVPVTVQPR